MSYDVTKRFTIAVEFWLIKFAFQELRDGFVLGNATHLGKTALYLRSCQQSGPLVKLGSQERNLYPDQKRHHQNRLYHDDLMQRAVEKVDACDNSSAETELHPT